MSFAGASLVLCPLKIELQTLLQVLKSDHHLAAEPHKINDRTFYFVPEMNAYFASGGLGKDRFANSVHFFLSKFSEVKTVVCAGAAGALSADVGIFDIIVAEEICEHDVVPVRFYQGSVEHLQNLKSFTSPQFRVHFGKMASGDENIMDHERAEAVLKQTGALGVAWEGAGGAKACQSKKVSYLEIRAVTDNARLDVMENFEKNLPQALTHLSQVLILLLKI